MKVLQIIENAYRCTVEEQDDPALWLCHAIKGAGAGFAVVFQGNAVNYLVPDQDSSGLRFGDRSQTQPPDLAREVQRLLDEGVEVYCTQEDASERGIDRTMMLPGIQSLPRSAINLLWSEYDQIWHW